MSRHAGATNQLTDASTIVQLWNYRFLLFLSFWSMPQSKRKPLSEQQLYLIAKALADPRRYEILKRIAGCEDALACESVRGCMEISAPTLSHHMRELELAGLIEPLRDGKFVSYVLRRDILEAYFGRLRRDLIGG
jgi:ArsR family transcriptional regulator